MLVEGLRNERLKDSRTSLVSPARLALLNAVKLTICSAIYLWRRRGANASTYHRILKEGQDEEQHLDDQDSMQTDQNNPNTTSWQSNRPSLRVWTGWSITCICAVAALYVLRDHNVSHNVLIHTKAPHTPHSGLDSGTAD